MDTRIHRAWFWMWYPMFLERIRTTIAREFLVALTGIALVGFILFHLGGNFMLFHGPDEFNAYARHLRALGPWLTFARAGLGAAFFAHLFFTIQLALANRAKRAVPYAVRATMGGTDFVKRTMLYTGILVSVFLFLHLRDFTFAGKIGAASVVPGMNHGESLGLYGLVWNAFANPLHSALYIVGTTAVGLHLSNSLGTFWVTLGLLTDAMTAWVVLGARVLGAAVALGFGSVPAYVLFHTYMIGV